MPPTIPTPDQPSSPKGPLGEALSRGRRASIRRRNRGRQRLAKLVAGHEATERRLLSALHDGHDVAEELASARAAFLADTRALAQREVRDGLRLGVARVNRLLDAAGVPPRPPSRKALQAAQRRAREQTDAVLERLEERLETMARKALAHSTPLLARRARVDRRSILSLDRNVSGGGEQAGMAAAAAASGVRYLIHVGPVDAHNHPVSHIYLGMVQTLADWELVAPGALTSGLHDNERGELVPVDPDFDGLEDPEALQAAIDTGEPYRRGDLFGRAELDALNRPLRPDEAAAVDQERAQIEATLLARRTEGRERAGRRARLAAARERLRRAGR